MGKKFISRYFLCPNQFCAYCSFFSYFVHLPFIRAVSSTLSCVSYIRSNTGVTLASGIFKLCSNRNKIHVWVSNAFLLQKQNRKCPFYPPKGFPNSFPILQQERKHHTGKHSLPRRCKSQLKKPRQNTVLKQVHKQKLK